MAGWIDERDVRRLTTVLVNGADMVTRAGTLGELVAELGHPPLGVATAVNGAFVARGRRDQTSLAQGDKVEIVAPRQGG